MRFGSRIFPAMLGALMWTLLLAACDGAGKGHAVPSLPASSGATTSAPTASPAPASAPEVANAPVGASVWGRWARSVGDCKHPELVLEAASARIETDADGKPVGFGYERVRYSVDAAGLVTVELGQPHPYGKTPSKTALTFALLAADEIGLSQAKRFVPFHRCAKDRP